jgi:predicted deacylase
MSIFYDFHGGSIRIIDISDNGQTRLGLKSDPWTRFAQGFFFGVVRGARSRDLVIEEVGNSTFPRGWLNYQAFSSRDNIHWERCESRYENGSLYIRHQQSQTETYYAYFPPYGPEKHKAMLAFCKRDTRASVTTLCATSELDNLDLISVGRESGDAAKIWIIGRQHPGETQPSWWMDGFLRRLLDPLDAQSRRLLDQVRFHIVPNMNPDGSRLGFYRTNINGHNLNASWDRATMKDTPAVRSVLDKMELVGIDLCLDIHGDEEIPFAFIASVDRLLPLASNTTRTLDLFEGLLGREDPNFLRQPFLDRPHIKTSPQSFCAPHLMQRFNIPAVTLELPFKRYSAHTSSKRNFGIRECMQSGNIMVSVIEGFLKEMDALKRRAGSQS